MRGKSLVTVAAALLFFATTILSESERNVFRRGRRFCRKMFWQCTHWLLLFQFYIECCSTNVKYYLMKYEKNRNKFV